MERRGSNSSLQIDFLFKGTHHSDEVNDFAKVDGVDSLIVSASDDKTLQLFDCSSESSVFSTIHTGQIRSLIFERGMVLTLDEEGNLCIWEFSNKELKLRRTIRVCQEDSGLSHLTHCDPTTFACCVYEGLSMGEFYVIKFTNDDFYSAEVTVNEIAYPLLHAGVKESHRCVHHSISMPNIVLYAGGDIEEYDGRDFRIKLFDWDQEKYLTCFQNTHKSAIRCLKSHMRKKLTSISEEVIISGGDDETIIFWDITGDIIRKLKIDNLVSQCLVSQNLNILFVGAYDNNEEFPVGALYYCDLTDDDSEFIPLRKVHDKSILRLKYLDEETQVFASCSSDGTVMGYKLLNEMYNHRITNFRLKKKMDDIHTAWIRGLDVLEDIPVLISVSDDMTIQFYDYQDFRIIHTIKLSHHPTAMRLIRKKSEEKYVLVILTDDSSSGAVLKIFEFSKFWALSILSKKQCDEKYEDLKFLESFDEREIRVGSTDLFVEMLEVDESSVLISSSETQSEYDSSVMGSLAHVDLKTGKFRVIYKSPSPVSKLCRSKKYEDVVYFGGGSFASTNGISKLVLQGRDLKGSRVDKDVCLKENTCVILAILTLIDTDGSELMVVGNNNFGVFVIREEKLVLKTRAFGEHLVSVGLFSDCSVVRNKSPVVVFGGGYSEGNLWFMDMKSYKMRKLTGSKNEHRDWISCVKVLPERGLIFSASHDSNIQMFSMDDGKGGIEMEDLNERLDFIRFCKRVEIKRIKVNGYEMGFQIPIVLALLG